MGGNALKKITTRRYDADEYHHIYNNKIKGIVQQAFPEAIFSRPHSTSSKKTFGDVDIIISRDSLPDNWKDILFKSFGSVDFYENFNTENNPDIHPRDERNAFSVNFKDLQIDFILTNDKCFDYTLNQLSFGDASGFIGRVFSSVFMHEDRFGLRKRLILNGIETKVLFNFSSDFDLNRRFLDYDPDVWRRGFCCDEDLFSYVTSSKFFNVELFNPCNFNSSQKLNYKKRESTRVFVDFCMSNYNNLRTDCRQLHEEISGRIKNHFPALIDIEGKVSTEYSAMLAKKMMFSHANISAIANDKNFKTDRFMLFIKKMDFDLNNNDFNRFVSVSSDNTISRYIKNRVNEFKSIDSAISLKP